MRMPSIYVGRPLAKRLREKRDELKRKQDVEYVPDKEALDELLRDDVVDDLESQRSDN